MTNKHHSHLRMLQLPVNLWDTIIVHLVSSRLLNYVKRSWEFEYQHWSIY